MSQGFAFAGANAWRVDRIMPVQELISTLVAEYEAAAAAEEAASEPERQADRAEAR
jgi:nitronate monooxygenase